MSAVLPLLLGAPLLVAGVLLLVPSLVLRRGLALGTTAVVLAYAVRLVAATADGSVLVQQVAGWPAGIAIPFAADLFSALVVTVAALLVLVCSWYAVATGDDEDLFFWPMVLVMSGGVYGAFVTADLFNLFVMIEVALVPSYVLLTRSGRVPQLAAGRVYLTVNLLISTVLLLGIALLYGVVGTVNLAELAGVARGSDTAALAAGVVLVALGGKAALVPLHSWLPRSYPYASTAMSAMFSGLLTKIGVYGVFRVYSVVFDGDPRWGTVLQVVLVATMVVGVLGALGETSMRTILSFHMTSQAGYILLGLGFFGVLGLAAGIFYLIHHMIVKAALFLATGAVEHTRGTGQLDRLGGVARREPLLAVVFMVAALSLTGIPPFSGFVAKFTLIRAAFVEEAWWAAGFAVAVSLFTLLSMTKIWNGAFWGEDPHPDPAAEPGGRLTTQVASVAPPRVGTGLVLPGLVLAAFSVGIGIGAEGLLSLSLVAAEGLVDTSAYVAAVSAP